MLQSQKMGAKTYNKINRTNEDRNGCDQQPKWCNDRK